MEVVGSGERGLEEAETWDRGLCGWYFGGGILFVVLSMGEQFNYKRILL